MGDTVRTGMSIVATLILFSTVGGVAAAQETTPSPTVSAQDRTITIGTTTDIRTTNPLRSLTGIEAFTFYFMYSGMLWYDREDLSTVPGLVESWSQSEDGLTWTFEFRDDLRWSDGEPLTARDFEFTANFLIENDKDIVSWNKNTDFPFTESITAVDDRTIVWETSQPTFAPGKAEYYLVLPEHIWGGMTGEEANKFNQIPAVTSGPFTIVEREQGQFWRLERNPYWFGEEPVVDEIVFRLFNTNEAMVQALRRGTIDFAETIPAPLFESIPQDEAHTTHVGAATSFANLIFNMSETEKSTGHPALLDVAVRRAIAFAIDKEALVERVLRGYATPGSTVVGPTYEFWHYEPTEEEFIGFDPAEANAILDEAGYADTDGDGVRESPGGGEPLEFRLNVVSSDSDAIRSAPFIEGWLRDIGIEVNTSSMNNASVLEAYYALDFDMYMYGWGTSPDPDFLLSTFTTDECGFWSDTCWSNPEYDALYEEQKRAFIPEERQELVYELQRMIYTQAPEIVLWYYNNLQSYRADRWTGFVELGPDGDLLDQATPYSIWEIEPPSAQAASAGTAEGGLSGVVWIAVLGGLALVVVLVLIARRRNRERA